MQDSGKRFEPRGLELEVSTVTTAAGASSSRRPRSVPCAASALRDDPPPLWTAMRDWFTGLVEECVGPEGSNVDDGYPGLGGSIGCDPTSAPPEPSEICASVAEAERGACVVHARAEIASFTHTRPGDL